MVLLFAAISLRKCDWSIWYKWDAQVECCLLVSRHGNTGKVVAFKWDSLAIATAKMA